MSDRLESPMHLSVVDSRPMHWTLFTAPTQMQRNAACGCAQLCTCADSASGRALAGRRRSCRAAGRSCAAVSYQAGEGRRIRTGRFRVWACSEDGTCVQASRACTGRIRQTRIRDGPRAGTAAAGGGRCTSPNAPKVDRRDSIHPASPEHPPSTSCS
jgi:hypothetical protein